MAKLKVLLATSYIDQIGGGVSDVVNNLATSDLTHDFDVSVVGVSSKERRRDIGRGNATYYELPAEGPLKLGFSFGYRKAIEEVNPDLIHVHGLWTWHNIAVSSYVKERAVKLIVSPHGMLSPEALSYSKKIKELLALCVQRPLLGRADALHATCDEEVKDISRFCLNPRVALIENGVYDTMLGPLRPERQKYFLSVSRLHHKKGLDLLLHAWKVSEARELGYELIVAGPDEQGYRAKLERIIEKEAIKGVSIIGEVYGAEKDRLMAGAHCFLLPTRSENFGLTVAESLLNATPVVCSKNAPWQELETNGCGKWIDLSIEDIRASLNFYARKSTWEIEIEGKRGRDWVLSTFHWDKIVGRYCSLYNNVLGK